MNIVTDYLYKVFDKYQEMDLYYMQTVHWDKNLLKEATREYKA